MNQEKMCEIKDVQTLLKRVLKESSRFSNPYGQVIRCIGEKLYLGWDPLVEIRFVDDAWRWKESERGALLCEVVYQDSEKLLEDIKRRLPNN